jgi:hypothetical protein
MRWRCLGVDGLVRGGVVFAVGLYGCAPVMLEIEMRGDR